MASTIPVEPASNGAAQTPEVAGEDSGYTIEKIKEHGTRDSFWILLHDKVYDITNFLDEHPGGDEVILEEAGRDATEAFEDVGHSDEARAMLVPMLLGDFKGVKTGKAAKKAAAAAAKATGGSSSSSSFPLWVFPMALFFAYIAWRVFLA